MLLQPAPCKSMVRHAIHPACHNPHYRSVYVSGRHSNKFSIETEYSPHIHLGFGRMKSRKVTLRLPSEECVAQNTSLQSSASCLPCLEHRIVLPHVSHCCFQR